MTTRLDFLLARAREPRAPVQAHWGQFEPEEHDPLTMVEWRSLLLHYLTRSVKRQTVATSAVNIYAPAPAAVTDAELLRVFDDMADTIQTGLAQSVASSGVFLVSQRLRELERRLAAVESRLLTGPREATPRIDWDQLRAVASEVSAELGWSGTWTVEPRERRIEFRVASKDAAHVADETFTLYQRLAQRVDPRIMQHITFDYEIVDR